MPFIQDHRGRSRWVASPLLGGRPPADELETLRGERHRLLDRAHKAEVEIDALSNQRDILRAEAKINWQELQNLTSDLAEAQEYESKLSTVLDIIAKAVVRVDDFACVSPTKDQLFDFAQDLQRALDAAQETS